MRETSSAEPKTTVIDEPERVGDLGQFAYAARALVRLDRSTTRTCPGVG
jgi:hypothetical protein